MFSKMTNLKSAIATMPRAIEKNDKRLLYYIHSTVIELLIHLDEEKKRKRQGQARERSAHHRKKIIRIKKLWQLWNDSIKNQSSSSLASYSSASSASLTSTILF